MEFQHKFAVTPPIWYTGERSWAELLPAQRILLGLEQKNIQALSEAVTSVGYGIRGPLEGNDNMIFVAAVLEYAARDREEAEIHGALHWLNWSGRILKLT